MRAVVKESGARWAISSVRAFSRLPLAIWFAFMAGSAPGQGSANPMSILARQEVPVQTMSPDPLDLNTASPAALAALPGMGRAYARRIVDGRPYTAKNQLVTRGVLPTAVYASIRDRVVAHHAHL